MPPEQQKYNLNDWGIPIDASIGPPTVEQQRAQDIRNIQAVRGFGETGLALLTPEAVATMPALRKVFEYFQKRYPRIMNTYVGDVKVASRGDFVSQAVKGRTLANTDPAWANRRDVLGDLQNMNLPKSTQATITFDPNAVRLAVRGPLESYTGLTDEEKLARIFGHELIHAVQYGRPDIIYNRLTSRTAIPPTNIDEMLKSYHNELEPPAYVGEMNVFKNYLRRRGEGNK